MSDNGEYFNLSYFTAKKALGQSPRDPDFTFMEFDTLLTKYDWLKDVIEAVQDLTGLKFYDWLEQYHPSDDGNYYLEPVAWADLLDKWLVAIRQSGVLTEGNIVDILGAAFPIDPRFNR